MNREKENKNKLFESRSIRHDDNFRFYQTLFESRSIRHDDNFRFYQSAIMPESLYFRSRTANIDKLRTRFAELGKIEYRALIARTLGSGLVASYFGSCPKDNFYVQYRGEYGDEMEVSKIYRFDTASDIGKSFKFWQGN